MLTRIAVIAFNTYRESVRARILHGLFGVALAAAAYSLVVGAYALNARLRVVSDLGAASTSLFAVVVAIVIGATSLYRELELKTIFPILARPIGRGEYLVGKTLGTVLTLAVFVAANSGLLLLALSAMAGRSPSLIVLLLALALVAIVLVAWRVPRARIWLPLVFAMLTLGAGVVFSAVAPDERRVIVGSAALVLCEVAIVTSIATLFSAFSSPFLTAIFTLGLFIVGRSADTLAALPPRVFGEVIHGTGSFLSKIVPNLMLYQPPRALLTGEAAGVELGSYLLSALLHAVAWSVLLLGAATLIFRRRDFL
ncbi:MAG TPA: ABC transporter permease subunit [Polyangiaceae bacterium]|jgi:ABC-type transport system involved in multi-copper enzyme maturation permease subunit|nr:ABC transporter permease subunit [Polyangiaceae bacterium]